ncbi:hypothetical protein [Lederbergia galactosidilytica]|uniref:Uncharacterized protein n=1 Tax=Lederbergia galactosidilytica TaxID=217031 RepID=A0A177ZTA5_9BACI|nr:hypothetical protein [Lederbergia galactosidilytica]OAK70078.1 hypothetical protein ABB05_12920 [Lederbergia galactosidilytica]
MSESFRLYKVVETEGMSAGQLQQVLNNATDGFPEMQIDHVIGTKIILGYESMLNAKGRAEAAMRRNLNKINNPFQGGLANG